MKKIVCAIMLISTAAMAQSPMTDLYQYNYTSISPAFAGLEGEKFTFMTGAFIPINGRKIISTMIGYETRIDKINSGIGFNASMLQVPAMSQTYYNLLYNYSFKVGENKLVVAGTFGFHQLTTDYSQYIDDPYDPLVASGGYRRMSRMQLGFSSLYKTPKFFVGVSMDNFLGNYYMLGGPFEAGTGNTLQWNIVGGTDLKLAPWLTSTHSLYVLTSDKNIWIDLNNSFLVKDWLIGGLTLGVDSDSDFIPKVNAGVKLKGNGQIVASVYSENYNRGRNKFQGQIMMVFNLN